MSIANSYGLSVTSVRRHKINHLPKELTKATEAEAVTQADNLISDLQGLRKEALTFLDKARKADDLRAAAPLISAACKVIELLAEVRNEIDRSATINVFLNPEFQQIQVIILEELEEYPEVRQKIVDRLAGAK